jgi:hypothetical protein
MEQSNSQKIRRRVERVRLNIPVRIEAQETKDTSWSEITRFQTLSSCGAGFESQHQVRTGQLILLTAPIPERLRSYDYMEQQYKVWGLVRYCCPSAGSSASYQVGVSFVGKQPPLSFQENPTTLYELIGYTKHGFSQVTEQSEITIAPEILKEPERPAEKVRKNAPRYPIPLDILIQIFDENQKITAAETTVSENVSVSGAAVFTSLEIQVGTAVSVYFRAFNICIQARVRNRRIGRDGMPRLHLEFLDRELPLEGID